ncbi:hypothetical protein [Nonomuraea roseoviolacea]|uniref:DNA-3-methyladenine glycosylase family protein n=1 Tax=Nonomuraea roseoviolacea TaxID=103837 RepID=UPI0031CF7293
MMLLGARAPFDFGASLRFLARFPPAGGEQEITGTTLVKAYRVAGHTVRARLSPAGAGLRCELESPDPLTDEVVTAAADRIRFHLSLDDDLTGFYEAADEGFRPVVERLRGYHQVKFPSPVENLVWAILCQRTPMRAAARAKAAIVAHAGNPYGAFPDVGQLLETPADLAGDPRKAGRLRAALEAWARTDEAFLRHGPYEEVKAFLLGLPGIGPWSASFVLIRGLGRMEEAPIDRELTRSAAAAYGRTLGERELRDLAAGYGPWQGYWAHYLRVAG